MQTTQSNECDEVILGFDTKWGYVEHSLENWYKSGPGPFYPFLRPDKIYCASDKRVLSERMLEMEYRNNWLSQFLIASGLFPYPWQYSTDDYPARYWNMPEFFQVIDGNTLKRSPSSYEVTKSLDGRKLEFASHLNKNFDMRIPSSFDAQFCAIFGHPSIFLKNPSQTIQEIIPIASNTNPFILAIQAGIYGHQALKISDEYYPNEDFASLIATSKQSLPKLEFYTICMESPKYKSDIVVLEAFIKSNSFLSHVIRIFGLTSLGNGLLLQKQAEQLLEGIEYTNDI